MSLTIVDKSGTPLTLEQILHYHSTFESWWESNDFSNFSDETKAVAKKAWEYGSLAEMRNRQNIVENYRRIENAKKYGR